jgi:predicted GIY-YIG superfamily endonuclease
VSQGEYLIPMPKPDRSLKDEPPESGWSVYILRCRDGSLYTGITKEVARRLRQHDAGTASKYTRSRLPVRLAHQEVHPDQSSALKRELAIKAMTRRDKLALIRRRKKGP